MRRLVALLAAVLVTAVSAAAAAAGTFTLHPSGFGEHSYSAWNGQQGLPDLTGNQNQALYFQKMTSTATNAAGVAVIKGFEGLPFDSLTHLEFWVGADGHCGAGAPRFDVFVQPMAGPQQTVFIGCQEMTPGLTATGPSGRTFQQRSYDGPFPSLGTITGIAIVFDEGNDVGQGFVYLDNIAVAAGALGNRWTSASDNGNGNGQTITQDPTGTDFLATLMGVPLSMLFPT
jgi:hypothetical protein